MTSQSGPIGVFLIFLRLGLVSFGGPVAHLGYFREAFVTRRKWLSDTAYAQLVALCQVLPGPASSQVGFALGLHRAGMGGALAAWLGFTLPSALVMMLFALYYQQLNHWLGSDWLHGLKVAAVAVVAQAVWGMGRALCPDRRTRTLAVLAMCGVLLLPGPGWQVLIILTAGGLGSRLLPVEPAELDGPELRLPYSRRWAWAFLLVSLALLIALPLSVLLLPGSDLRLLDSFYRAGALVFGGGHVVLPLLQAEMVPSGLVGQDSFMAGYGMAQAVPGPLFTFAAYLGMQATGTGGALVALLGIFLPGFLLLLGVLPFYHGLYDKPLMQSALRGINAAVVGILLAALYQPVWLTAILSIRDFVLLGLSMLLLMSWQRPVYQVVGFCALAAGLGWH
ncbi:chromate efflux transporter [Bowmanella dokdonensis]|uniref:Chromate efflux transporter n=1 Tax=Bowmanella dokdonensis TaxID=751969 RepID=A0A939DLA5_9ALTE|nr:chromate efflux transporter [Bowmanella dokdonensis]MBN7824722.1 chromate efflux transporter [Bowmanella dokdonensis]